MSKSYDNTIPLFLPEKQLRKAINRIKTNLLEPGEPKEPDTSTVFQLWAAFATPAEVERMRAEFENGIAWGEAKKQLFELVNGELAPARERYQQLLDDPGHIEETLQRGGERARDLSGALMQSVREAVGISPDELILCPQAKGMRRRHLTRRTDRRPPVQLSPCRLRIVGQAATDCTANGLTITSSTAMSCAEVSWVTTSCTKTCSTTTKRALRPPIITPRPGALHRVRSAGGRGLKKCCYAYRLSSPCCSSCRAACTSN